MQPTLHPWVFHVDQIGFRILQTNSNTLHITRLLDTPEHKKVWAKYGPRALQLAKVAKAKLPNDPEVLVAYADSFFFANAVKGVLSEYEEKGVLYHQAVRDSEHRAAARAATRCPPRTRPARAAGWRACARRPRRRA